VWDAAQRAGSWGAVKPGTILGADGSGTIAAVAADVSKFKVGDRVYSYSYGNPSGGFHALWLTPRPNAHSIVDAVGPDVQIAGSRNVMVLTEPFGAHFRVAMWKTDTRKRDR
jgi:NADPH:quinone reductase